MKCTEAIKVCDKWIKNIEFDSNGYKEKADIIKLNSGLFSVNSNKITKK